MPKGNYRPIPYFDLEILSVCYIPVFCANGLMYCYSFFHYTVILSRHSRQREQLSASVLFVCLFMCCQNAKKNTIFSKTNAVHRDSYCRIICAIQIFFMYVCMWAFQRTHYWTPKIQDGGYPPSWIVTPKSKNSIFSKTTK